MACHSIVATPGIPNSFSLPVAAIRPVGGKGDAPRVGYFAGPFAIASAASGLTGTSATVSSVTLSRVSEIIAQRSPTSMRPPSTSKAHGATETRNHDDKGHGHQTLAESCPRHHAGWQRGDLLIARHDRRLERRRRPRS